MHAKLEKLCASFKQMDYTDFMHFLGVFFGLINLKNKVARSCATTITGVVVMKFVIPMLILL